MGSLTLPLNFALMRSREASPNMANSSVNVGLLDYSKERSGVGFRVADITDGTTLAARITAFGTYITALGGVCSGTVVSSQVVQNKSKFLASPPSDTTSQRELKWLVEMQDTAGNVSDLTLPTADVLGADLLLPNSDIANWTGSGAAAAWTTYVTAHEALYRNKFGNSVTITGIRLVGRNL